MSQVEAPGLPPPSPQPPDRTRPVPPHIADVLNVLRVLLVYGRHIALTLEVRRTASRFAVIAQFFGTAHLPLLRARITRGLLRIQALQRVLLDRSRRGRDLVWLRRIVREPRQKPPGKRQPAQPLAAAARRVRASAEPDPDDLPSLQELEAHVRRRGVGGSVADICRDLGVSPRLCDRGFLLSLIDVLAWYRGNVAWTDMGFRRRAKAFRKQCDRDLSLGLPGSEDADIEQVFGFTIGESWPRLPHSLTPPVYLAGLAAPRTPHPS